MAANIEDKVIEKLRVLPINHYGLSCIVCGLNFGDKYGKDFQGLIHVHHLRPLASIAANYVVNPVNDLRPVCPNCHAAMHYRKDPPYSVEEMKQFLRPTKNLLTGS